MEEELYYTPHIADIRVGYVCQCSDGMKMGEDGEVTENWYVTTVTKATSFESVAEMIAENRLRTRFLMIPDFIETFGWMCEGKVEPPATDPVKETVLYKFNKGKYILIYDFIAKVVMIAISVGDIFSVCIQRFDCPSPNEFAYIEAHLNLHNTR